MILVSEHYAVDDGDVGSGDVSIAVNIASGDECFVAAEQVVVDAGDVGGCDFSVAVHVTHYHCRWVEA